MKTKRLNKFLLALFVAGQTNFQRQQQIRGGTSEIPHPTHLIIENTAAASEPLVPFNATPVPGLSTPAPA